MSVKKRIIMVSAMIVGLMSFAETLTASAATEQGYPDYEFRKSNTLTLKRVERSDTATRIDVHATYRPHYWIRIDSAAALTDPLTGKRYNPVRGEGITLNDLFWMPDEGEADFTIIYPPLPAEVKAVNFDEDDWGIYGLRLDGNKAVKTSRVDPDEWSARNEKPYPGVPDEFFKEGECLLSGRINGYDRRLGFSNMVLYLPDPLTSKELPVSVEIKSDGTFSASLPLVCPGFSWLNFNNMLNVNLYLEPGRTVEMLVDWEDILKCRFDRICDKPVDFSAVRFGGDLGEINHELACAPAAPVVWIGDIYKTMTPSNALKQIEKWDTEYGKSLDGYVAGAKLHPHTLKLLDINRRSNMAYQLLDYAMMRENVIYEDSLAVSLSEPLTMEYYSSLKDVIADEDPWFLANSEIRTISNRMAFCNIFELAGIKYLYRVEFKDMELLFLKEKGAVLTPEEEQIAQMMTENLGTVKYLTIEELMALYKSSSDDIAERNGMMEELKEFRAEKTPEASDYNYKAYYAKRQSVFMKDFAGTDDIPLLWQAVQSSTMCSYSSIKPSTYSREEALAVIKAVVDSGAVTNPIMIKAMNEHIAGLYENQAYTLPDDERGRVVRDIIAPHAGKFLLLDMWGTYCGPCRSNIEQSADMRRANRDNPDFKMIFITSDGESPEGAYNKYVAANLEGEVTHRIPASDFNRLRDLFRFSGIPRYILIDKEGNVANDNFNVHNLRSALEEYGVTLK